MMPRTHQEASQGAACLTPWAVICSDAPEPRNPQVSYYRARYYDQNVGRFLSEDPINLEAGVNFYAYVWDDPANGPDPSGLDGGDANGHAFPPYSNMPPDPLSYKPGIPHAKGYLRDLLKCMGNCYGKPLLVTSTDEMIPQHPWGTPHRRFEAADIRYPSDPRKLLCCATKCGAGFGLDEKEHPSAPGVAPHIHVQIPAGTHGGHGDLPPKNCHDCER
jgi:hypothetical protein